jgi:hypothetical protein
MEGLTIKEQAALYIDKRLIITARPKWMSFEAYKTILAIQKRALKKHKKGTVQFVAKNHGETTKGTTKVNEQ